MPGGMNFFVSAWTRLFFLLTPFFALSMFLSMTSGQSEARRHRLALRVTAAASVLCFVIYFFGNVLFSLFGITLDAFRVGAGALLFLSAVKLVQAQPIAARPSDDEDIAVVPLAIPITVGPATIGALLVMGAELKTASEKGLGCLALASAIIGLGVVLFLGTLIERGLGKRGINILSKVTGLVLSALASQMVLQGARNILAAP